MAKRPALLLCKDQGFFLQSAFSSSHRDHFSWIVLLFMLNEKEKTKWQKKSRDNDTKKMDFETQDFSYTMEDSWKSFLWQWTANNEEKNIPRSLCIFEMTYGCEILRQRMRQSNFSMPTWKTLNWTDLHQWHLVNVLSKKLLVQIQFETLYNAWSISCMRVVLVHG